MTASALTDCASPGGPEQDPFEVFLFTVGFAVLFILSGAVWASIGKAH